MEICDCEWSEGYPLVVTIKGGVSTLWKYEA